MLNGRLSVARLSPLIAVLKKTTVNPEKIRDLAGKMSNEPAKSADCGFNRGFL
jgi:hypothetical protein